MSFIVHVTTVGLFTADKTSVHPRKIINTHFTAKQLSVRPKRITEQTLNNAKKGYTAYFSMRMRENCLISTSTTGLRQELAYLCLHGLLRPFGPQ